MAMADGGPILWAWTGVGAHPAPPAEGHAAWVAAGGPAWGPAAAGGAEGVHALLACAGGVAAVGPWIFAGRVRGRSVREYRPAAGAVAGPADADPGLGSAGAFLCDRAGEVVATGAPWWTAWRQAAAALCETYEGCAFDLAWTDGAVLLALVQTVALALHPDGSLAVAEAAAAGGLARGRAELARLGLYAGGRCLAVAPITGGA
jgi:hypothetical protein